ncbi:Uncharacterised protein [Niallia circulans]|nr:Uncharacterised protein [Niallia circulans]
MIPDTVGPIAGANIMTSPTIPMAAPRRSIGITAKMTFVSRGIMSAVPTACVNRPTSNIANTGLNPAINVPSVNSDIAVINNCRVVKRCIKYAEMGINVPITNI